MNIPMVNHQNQYEEIRNEISAHNQNCLDTFQKFRLEKNIQSMNYNRSPLYHQEVFVPCTHKDFSLLNTEQLCKEVLSLPIHKEFNKKSMGQIMETIKSFFTL